MQISRTHRLKAKFWKAQNPKSNEAQSTKIPIQFQLFTVIKFIPLALVFTFTKKHSNLQIYFGREHYLVFPDFGYIDCKRL